MLLITIALSIVCVLSITACVYMYQQVQSMKAQLVAAHTNTSFNCLTRTGVRVTWKGGRQGLVFMDLDHMHGLNSLLGYAQVDALIHRALATLRSTDTVSSVGQWMSGDEFIITCKAGEEVGLATRLRNVMNDITAELRMDSSIVAKHAELLATDARYGMSVPTFAATYGCVITVTGASLEESVNSASAKVQLAKANGDRGTVN